MRKHRNNMPHPYRISSNVTRSLRENIIKYINLPKNINSDLYKIINPKKCGIISFHILKYNFLGNKLKYFIAVSQ